MTDLHSTSEMQSDSARRLWSDGGTERRFWRSLEEANGSPEFEEYLHREFPSQLAVWEDPVGRRQFLKLMAASLAFAGVSGCTRTPEEKIVPYVRTPEEVVPGKPLFYATAMPRNGFGYGVLAESHLGRPTKIEGNPAHPASLGATDAFMQASVLGLYDPDRSQTILQRGNIATWEACVRALTADMQAVRKRQGRGLRILTETVTSPTLAGQILELLQTLPEARWHVFDAVGQENAVAGSQLAFGQVVDTVLHFDQAQIIVSLDSDFLFGLPGSLQYAREFIDRRRVVVNSQSMNRLYVAESTPTITGASADHRIAVAPSTVGVIARELLRRTGENGAEVADESEGQTYRAWLDAVVADLKEHRGASIVVAGRGQPPAVHAIAHALNQALGNVGKTVTYIEPVAARPPRAESGIGELLAAMNGGEVETLVILEGNPVYNVPGELQFAKALEKVRLKVHLSDFADETSAVCDWHVPAAHYLESWSDIRAYDGTASIIQPLIAPLYEGKTAHELVSVLAGKPTQSPFETVQRYWQQTLAADNFGDRWERALHDGLIADTQLPTANVTLSFDPASAAEPEGAGDEKQSIEIDVRPDPSVWDGQFANNAWLQELPKPLSKITWDNVASMSLKTAASLYVSSGDVIAIEVQGRTVLAPAWVAPGQADNCITLTCGYGRTHSGRVGSNVGYNAYAIKPGTTGGLLRGSIRKTDQRYKIATTQNHHSMEGRDIVRVKTLDEVQHPQEHGHDALHAAGEKLSIYPGFKYEGNAWGMVVDQTACIGCNACVVACQAENNIPVVGKEQVGVGREMHWLRIDRYYEGEESDPDIYFQPMMCVHCEQAPCEVVCPVAATVHDSEGTSNMVYNRCVGTRYCSNNCPYKVRRFNYLQFSDETTPSLKLLRNPDVTVRSRGVMEKCSYCSQRINSARIDAKIEHLPFVPDGEVVTACQQACPTRAIVFGNLTDPDSEARKLKQSPLNYGVLAELNTQPRTTYLARVTNPHASLTTQHPAPDHDHPAASSAAAKT